MGVNVSLVKEHAPDLVETFEAVHVHLKKANFDPEANKAAVVLTIDDSTSTENLYAGGLIQKKTDLAFTAGLVFDDDGEVPASLFASDVHDLGDLNLSNYNRLIPRRPRGGGTNYYDALGWIITQAGFGKTKLGGGLFSRSNEQSVKATAEYPTFAIVITDGEPNGGTEEKIYQRLREMSQLPIFVQFLGVTDNDRVTFDFLNELNELDGTFIDSAGFFDTREASNQEQMLKGLLNEFPGYYDLARNAGMLNTKATV